MAGSSTFPLILARLSYFRRRRRAGWDGEWTAIAAVRAISSDMSVPCPIKIMAMLAKRRSLLGTNGNRVTSRRIATRNAQVANATPGIAKCHAQASAKNHGFVAHPLCRCVQVCTMVARNAVACALPWCEPSRPPIGYPSNIMIENIVIVGAGQAAAQAVDALRRRGFHGSISMVGEEPFWPYQRPPLSKKYLTGALERDRLAIRYGQFKGVA